MKKKKLLLGSETVPVKINDYKICAFTKNISFFSFLFIEAALLFAVMKFVK